MKLLAPLTLLIALCGCSVESGGTKSFSPQPANLNSRKNPPSEDKIALGRMLYYDTRLSRSQTVSCNTCHPLTRYGVDGTAVSIGHRGLKGNRNAPTVYNAAGHIAQFWDGRAPDVEEQAKGPLTNPVEMALANADSAVAMLKSIPGYMDLFRAAFPGERDPISFDNIAKAIGVFERGLTTPTRWDRYLNGDSNALTPAEKAGFQTFAKAGCPSCHMGPLLGGNIYQKLGIANPWPEESDMGVFMISGKEADKLVFKVPSLLNIAETGPYFHNGKVAKLEDAVRKMGHYQLGKELTEDEVRGITTWLRSLTGEIPHEYIRKPELPPNGPTTPAPDLS
jgi:cytochrome c peroxidase